MIRPELVARFKPWREVAAAVLTGLAGIWIFSLGGLLLQPLGGAILAFAILWGWGAWRRRRFAVEIAAPGLVEIEEGAIRYYGARALGGEVALRDLSQIRLIRLDGHAHWRLRTRNGEAVLIPVEAAGAAALADAFAALPGFDLGAAAAALAAKDAFRTVWQRPD
ncbi:hypothetical protein [Paracoccus sp. MC1862]|uniref:hypothetical protein n=1 Tax=Paracoccus sp. MC1862 TaxID=2760307 RepID=UPI001600B1C0|nr:hypothetical protein [Paracoccus sp. MC1862]MBB1499243.1 hypothetical protein [Paracoccus sp. MC1862]QQO44873.1 hypothetical protein JGR78_00060 [Paracoccus sp. MC1862]